MLNVGNRIFIVTPWDETQLASEGDYFVSLARDFDEIYRVGKSEINETYALWSASDA